MRQNYNFFVAYPNFYPFLLVKSIFKNDKSNSVQKNSPPNICRMESFCDDIITPFKELSYFLF